MNDRRYSLTDLGFGAFLVALIASLFGIRFNNQVGNPVATPAATPPESPPISSFELDSLDPKPLLKKYFDSLPRSVWRRPDGNGEVESHDPLYDLLAPAWRRSLIGLQRPFTRFEAEGAECFIVGVPDPIDTPFGFWFDHLVEVIVTAAGAAGYTAAGHWFPWEAYRYGNEAKDRESTALALAPFEKRPGVMLFRNHNDPSRTLVVLLVGETVNGVRSDALRQALELAREIDLKRRAPTRNLRIVAPYFSGAQANLFLAMQKWADEQGDEQIAFDVICGAANGLDLDLGKTIFRPATRCKLRASIIPSSIQQTAAVRFLRDRAIARGATLSEEASALAGVALLVESNTGFGFQQLSGSRAKDAWPLYLTYPMHHSRVVAEYERRRQEREKQFVAGEAGQSNGGVERPPRPNSDFVTNLDDVMTPRLVDRSLEDLTAAIRRHRIRYVGLIVTDPQDAVFLVERIKQDCQDVAIFVTGMDLVYALPENRYAMREVLLTSTYPLFPPNQKWTEPSIRLQRSFQNEAAQGCYNAIVFHLAESTQTDFEAREEFLRKSLREYSPPVFALNARNAKSPARPPVWMFSIGENGRYVPYGFYENYTAPWPREANNQDAPRTDELMVDGPARGSRRAVDLPLLGTFSVPAVLLLLVSSVVISRAARSAGFSTAAKFSDLGLLFQKAGWRRFTVWASAPLPRSERRNGIRQSLALTAAIVSLAAFLGATQILLGPSFRHTPTTRVWLPVAAASGWSMLIAGLALQARLTFQHVQRASSAANLRDAGRLGMTALLFAAAAGVCACLLSQTWGLRDRSAQVLLAERTVNLQTGLSVLTPLLLLAAGVLANVYCSDMRLTLHRRFRILSPYPDDAALLHEPLILRVCRRLRESTAGLHEELNSFTGFLRRRLRWLLVAGLVFGLGLLAYWSSDGDLRTSEGRLWDKMFLVGFVLLAARVTIDTTLFLAGWKDLELLLKLMAMLPMAGAYDRMPRKTADLFGGYLRSRRPRSSHLAIPLQLLRQLREESHGAKSRETSTANESAAVASPARMPSIEGCPARIAACLDLPAAWPRLEGEPADREFPAQRFNVLSKTSRTLIAILADYWPRRPVREAFGEDPSAEGKESDSSARKSPRWAELAEDFVAIQAIIFLSQFFIQLRMLAFGTVWTSVLLMLAATAYPFQPERLILYLLFGLLFAVSGAIVWVLIQVNKNEIVSRITRSTPNKFQLDWEFVHKILLYLGPILLVIGAQLSGRARVLVEPWLNVIR